MTVKVKTAKALRESAKSKGLTIDNLLANTLSQSNELFTCSLCGGKIKVPNMISHMAKVHPK